MQNLENNKRVILIVIDSVGIGEMPDAALFGDEGMDTLGNLSKYFDEGLCLPNLEKLGLGNIASLKGVRPQKTPDANFGKCAESSPAKDTTIGHWEIAGVISKNPLPTYPKGFPAEIINTFSQAIGIGVIGNYPASGTEIIKALGDEHVRTKKPIVYTSADSVFQIACHEEIYPPEKLYEICKIARKILCNEHAVGRVIARPFIGTSNNYKRTANRRDFSLSPPQKTILDILKDKRYSTIGIGKIGDIFNHQGITEEIHTHSNAEGIKTTIDKIKEQKSPALIFTNLVDFDMLFGHRNDPIGYRNALMEFDNAIPEIISNLNNNDMLIITADHGCDPTQTRSTDHSREYVPLIVLSHSLKSGINLGTRKSFTDIAKTVLNYFFGENSNLENLIAGESFLGMIKK